MDIQQLRYVVALSQEMHFHRAAAKVNVTQPTLSQGIKKLEEEIGTRFFERSPQKVRITPAGKKFLPYAMRALEQIKEGSSAIRQDLGEIMGEVKVGVIPTLCPYIMPKAISLIQKNAPKLRFKLVEEMTAVLLGKIKDNQLDFGVLALPIKDTSLKSEPIQSESFYVAVSKNHALAEKKRVSLEDVLKEKIHVLKEGHCFGDQVMSYCKLNRKDSNIIFEGSNLASVIQMASSGMGVAFVPEIAIPFHKHPSITFLPIHQPTPSRDIGIVWRKTSTPDRAQKFCTNIIKKTYHLHFTQKKAC